MRVGVLVAVVALLVAGMGVVLLSGNNEKDMSNKETKIPGTLSIVSSAFSDRGKISSRYTCDGDDTNPPLSISGVPKEAKTLVLIMEDPDVPKSIRSDGLWVHWVKFNIPPTTVSIDEGVEPLGVSGLGTARNLKYHGPCPPDREHRYFFKLYALDVELNLVEGASRDEVLTAMQGHVLETAELMGRYERIK